MLVVGIGLVVGGIGAVLAARYAVSLLYGLTGASPAVIATGTIVLAVIAGLAIAMPAVGWGPNVNSVRTESGAKAERVPVSVMLSRPLFAPSF